MERDHRIKWAGDLRFIGTSGSGNSIVIDGDKTSGVSPMELMLTNGPAGTSVGVGGSVAVAVGLAAVVGVGSTVGVGSSVAVGRPVAVATGSMGKRSPMASSVGSRVAGSCVSWRAAIAV